MSEARRRFPRVASVVLAAVAVAMFVIACGDDDSSGGGEASGGLSEMTSATLVLDFLPNGVHAGIYQALEAGYYEEENIDLEIIQPNSTADTLKWIDAGKADFGIADGIDVGAQIAEGRDAKGVMALLERPPGGLITLRESNITDPKQLEGETVGVTGVASDSAILDTVVSDAGGNPDNVDVVTVGFNGVQNLESEKVAAFTGFVPADGVQIEQDGYPIRSFELDEWGGPSYPGLVVFSTQEKIAAEPALMSGFVEATVRGYEDALENPEAAVKALVSAVPGTDEELAAATFEAYSPLFQGDAPRYGEFVTAKIEELSEFMVDNELSESGFSPDRYGTNEFLPDGEG